jgi:hypothetical protein
MQMYADETLARPWTTCFEPAPTRSLVAGRVAYRDRARVRRLRFGDGRDVSRVLLHSFVFVEPGVDWMDHLLAGLVPNGDRRARSGGVSAAVSW